MATEIKKTKKEFYEEILKYDLTEEQATFIQHEIELLTKRGSKTKKVDAAIAELENKIFDMLCDSPDAMTCTEISKAMNFEYSTQKISAHLKKLKDANKVKKIVKKGKSYFSVECINVPNEQIFG